MTTLQLPETNCQSRPDFHSECNGCGTRWSAEFVPFCLHCDGLVEVPFDLERAQLRESGNPYERFYDLLPVRDSSWLPRDACYTPMVHAQRLGDELGLARLYLKNETVLPTGTTKDRMAAVALAFLYECGVRELTASSTGNSSTSFAHAVARFPGMRIHLFVAEEFADRLDCPAGDQVRKYVLKDASFVDAANAAQQFADETGITSERGFFNPGRREGLKLAFLEAVDQIPDGIDWYVQAVSSAMGVHGVYKAATELKQIGEIESLPRLLCVQQETCAPMVNAWNDGSEVIQPRHIVQRPRGIAKAILRGNPSKAYPHVCKAVVHTNGTFAAVSESEIREAHSMLKELEGVDACFASSAAFAGVIKLNRKGLIPNEDTILVNLTGRERAVTNSALNGRRLVRARATWEFADEPEVATFAARNGAMRA